MFRLPLVVALAMTLWNATKPVVVDDTAYLLRAQYIAEHPADPYGGTLFWNSAPEPAMDVLAPPLLPYWLALGMRLFGEHLFALKLWLFPFAWLLCASMCALLRRFAGGAERPGLILFAAAIVPLFNFMLDLPALAIGTAAVAVFLCANDRKIWPAAVLVGVLMALAMQTKYSMLVVPAVIGWVGLTHRRILPALVAILVAVDLCAYWELAMAEQYSQSHFLLHSRGELGGSVDANEVNVWEKAAAFVDKRAALPLPLLAQLGGLSFGILVWQIWIVLGRRWLFWPIVGVLFSTLVAVLFLTYSQTVLYPEAIGAYLILDLPTVLFGTVSLLLFALLGVGCGYLLLRDTPRRTLIFLAGWLLIEIAACLVLSPFPAARRVLGVEVVMALMAARVAARFGVIDATRQTKRWLLLTALIPAVVVASVDNWDAWPEKVLAERAAEVVQPAAGETVWFRGHWGFQWYCERSGMRPVVVNQSRLRKGDWLVYPYLPDAGFYRPYHGGYDFPIANDHVEWIADLIWLDGLSGQTIPNMHGGSVVISGRDHPRLKVGIFRVTKDWVPSTR